MSARSIEKLQLDGGCSVFDFTNTINNRHSGEPYDYLNSYDDILLWNARAGILPAERISALSRYASDHRTESDLVFVKAKRAREVLYKLFSNIGKKKRPDVATQKEFNEILSECLCKLKLSVTTENSVAYFTDTNPSLDEPLCIVVKSAYDILTGEDYTRLKECPNCGWLFIDRTRNGKRKWCDMQVCGSRDKANRYYHRKKGVSD